MLIVLPIDLKIPLQNYIFEGSFRQISISKMAWNRFNFIGDLE